MDIVSRQVDNVQRKMDTMIDSIEPLLTLVKNKQREEETVEMLKM